MHMLSMAHSCIEALAPVCNEVKPDRSPLHTSSNITTLGRYTLSRPHAARQGMQAGPTPLFKSSSHTAQHSHQCTSTAINAEARKLKDTPDDHNLVPIVMMFLYNLGNLFTEPLPVIRTCCKLSLSLGVDQCTILHKQWAFVTC